MASSGGLLPLARERVDRTLRQLTRTRRLFVTYLAQTETLSPVNGQPLSPLLVGLMDDFRDQAAFLVVAVRQAIAAHSLVLGIGYAVPPFENAAAWINLRDVEEHWHNHQRGEPLRARRKWDELGHSGMPGREYGGNLPGDLPV